MRDDYQSQFNFFESEWEKHDLDSDRFDDLMSRYFDDLDDRGEDYANRAHGAFAEMLEELEWREAGAVYDVGDTPS